MSDMEKLREILKAMADQEDTITALRAENERLWAVLKYIAWEQKEGDQPHLIARAALDERPKEDFGRQPGEWTGEA